MKVFEIDNIKDFMKHLLIKNTFDDFIFNSGYISSKFYSSFEGRILDNIENHNENIEKFIKYSIIKPILFEIIKGDKQPSSFKMILGFSCKNIKEYQKIHQEKIGQIKIKGLFININFEMGRLYLTSGCSMSGFDIDKMTDKIWDMSVEKFLMDKGLIK